MARGEFYVGFFWRGVFNLKMAMMPLASRSSCSSAVPPHPAPWASEGRRFTRACGSVGTIVMERST